MEPVINPWIIYWISVLSNIGGLLALVMCLSIISSIIIGVIHIADRSGCYSSDLDFPNWFKYFELSIIIACISSLICIFIPDKQTMITMVVTSYVTPDNINITTDYVVELAQRIAEAVKEVE